MEFMIAWYPTLKIVITLILIGVSVMLIKKGHIKWGVSMLIFIAWVFIMIPVHIDGTNSNTSMKKEINEQSNKYKIHAEEAIINIKPVLTFKEEMALVDAENARKNKLLEESLK